jgi:succinate-semialdehyde dehydrogenase/glutarate-semialdehyde dehydrogenase
VLLGIMPWNFPYYQVARFAAPNLAIGNTILLKHAPQCPESAPRSPDLRRRGLPRRRLRRRPPHERAGRHRHRRPACAGRLGDRQRARGAAVAEIAGRNLKKVVLELGGSDPFILLSTDDLDAAVQMAVDARLDNNGQSCNGAKRFIVADDLYDAFVEKFARRWRMPRSATRSPRTRCSGRCPRSPPPSGSRSRSIAPSRRARRS